MQDYAYIGYRYQVTGLHGDLTGDIAITMTCVWLTTPSGHIYREGTDQ